MSHIELKGHKSSGSLTDDNIKALVWRDRTKSRIDSIRKVEVQTEIRTGYVLNTRYRTCKLGQSVSLVTARYGKKVIVICLCLIN
jgi:hypothetical protein